MESSPKEILDNARKHKHNYGVVTEPMTVGERNFQVYNITLKKVEGSDDLINYRRGLAYTEEIVDFKNVNFEIAKKGLRKFHDLIPETLDMKQSHFTTNRHQLSIKTAMMKSILNSKQPQICIIETEKLNGENMQISCISEGEIWVIGTKNKCLFLRNQQDIENVKFKHEHNQTIVIARKWLQYVEQLKEEQRENLMKFLSKNTLVGEYVNTENRQHLVKYEEPQVFFYALVDKEDLENSCRPFEETVRFCQIYQLQCAEYKKTIIKNDPQLIIQTLSGIVNDTLPQSIEKCGEGLVLYIEEHNSTEGYARNLQLAKVKTLEYRIYRKLREKLKVFVQKSNKSYEKFHKKFTQEVEELVGDYKTPEPLQKYFAQAERALNFCSDPYHTKAIAKYVNNKYIDFMNLIQDPEMTAEKFIEIVNQGKNEEKTQNSNKGKKDQYKLKEQPKTQAKVEKSVQENLKIPKKVLVFVPMTIPSTGKSSLFNHMKANHQKYPVHIVSSDKCRLEAMNEKMKRNKNMKSKDAYEKTRKEGNTKFYNAISDIFKIISESKEEQHVFLIDKNHPENALKTGVSEIQTRAGKFQNLSIKIVCLLSDCREDNYIELKGKYFYPFSAQYALTCLKRVSQREEHETLQGSVEERLNIVVNFLNMFRNFQISNYNLGKYFDYVTKFRFYQEDAEKSKIVLEGEKLLVKILMGSRPGSFDPHDDLPELAALIKQYEETKSSISQAAEHSFKEIQNMFQNFEGLTLKEEKQEPQK